jgi:Ulp1 family protease
VVDFKLKRFEYHDSLLALHDPNLLIYVKQIQANIQRYIRDDANVHSGIPQYDFTGWTLYIPRDTPQQSTRGRRLNDCGVFLCKMCQSRVIDKLPGGPFRAEFAFASRDTNDLRQGILAELLAGQLL